MNKLLEDAMLALSEFKSAIDMQPGHSPTRSPGTETPFNQTESYKKGRNVLIRLVQTTNSDPSFIGI